MTNTAPHPFRLVIVSAGTSDPSSTSLLADRIGDRTCELAACHGQTVTSTVVELPEIAADIASALVSQLSSSRLRQRSRPSVRPTGSSRARPSTKAGRQRPVHVFFHILDDDLIIARPVVLAATAGTARHALVVDDQMRSMFSYLRALVVPTSLFAAPEDWSDPALNKRIDRAAVEFVLLMESGFARKIRDASWENYQHEYGSAGGTEVGIDLDTDLMRLAAGGSAQ